MDKAKNQGTILPSQLLKEAEEAGAQITQDGYVKLSKHYTFHDIKAKGATNHSNHHTGHLSEKMKAVYNRKPELVEATR